MPAQHLNALLVEDDDAYATMLQRELAAEPGAPVSVQRVRSLSDAVLRLTSGDFDAVLLDLAQALKTVSPPARLKSQVISA